MSNKTIPLFKSHYSLGRSILTLSDEDNASGPDSIIGICKKHNLSQMFLVEDSMSGFLEAYTNSEKNKIQLIYGIRLTICRDMEKKNEQSLSEESKYIIFAKNKDGYKKLIKIYSEAATKGFYYVPRFDFDRLKENWDNESLELCVPFYDSFLFKNCLLSKRVLPKVDFTELTFFEEENNLPFDDLLKRRLRDYTDDGKKYNSIPVQTIYYKEREDFLAYLTHRCINKRSTLNRPNLDHMHSKEFCFESWLEGEGGKPCAG
jgi:DNA polymerase III alpha subunit